MNDINNSISVFESFVKDGYYGQKKQAKISRESARTHLEKEFIQSENKRHEFKDIGMVAKFVPKEIKQTNHSGLITGILDYVRSDALSDVITLNKKQLEEEDLMEYADEFLRPSTYYLKPTLNKVGNSYSKTVSPTFEGESVTDVLKFYQSQYELENMLTDTYNEVLNLFNSMDKRKIVTEVGSISKIANKPVWDINSLIKKYGEQFIVDYGQVKLSELDKWVNMHVIPKYLLSQNQVVTDIRLDFMVMTLEAEGKAFQAFLHRRNQVSNF